jgi:hypothetical protein
LRLSITSYNYRVIVDASAMRYFANYLARHELSEFRLGTNGRNYSVETPRD